MITASVIQHPILVVDHFSSFLSCSVSILQRGDYSLCYSTSNSSCRSPIFLHLLFLFHTPESWDYSLCYSTSNSSCPRFLLFLPLLFLFHPPEGWFQPLIFNIQCYSCRPPLSFLYCTYSTLQRVDYSRCYSTFNSSCRSPLFLPLLVLFHPPMGWWQPLLFNILF